MHNVITKSYYAEKDVCRKAIAYMSEKALWVLSAYHGFEMYTNSFNFGRV